MCFHGNQHPWATKHPFISLYSKYQSLKYICLPVMNFPVFPSLDDINCITLLKVAFGNPGTESTNYVHNHTDKNEA